MRKQKIIHFYCRPCGEYHLKTHLHYREMLKRKEHRANEHEAKGRSK
jgi:hypothetical protein